MLNAQIEQIVSQGTTHEELHAQVVNLLGIGFGSELFVLCSALCHHGTNDHNDRFIDFLIGRLLQFNAKGLFQIGFDLCLNVFHWLFIIHNRHFLHKFNNTVRSITYKT